MPSRVRLAIFCLLGSSACGGGAPPGGAVDASGPKLSGRPDIVIVTIDTLRADHLGCYGYFRPTSPNIDTLARESLVFEHCLAPMATTLPTHTSLFTGTWPLEHGVLANVIERKHRFQRSEALITFAEYLKGIGYETAAFVSGLPLKRQFDLDAGFDVYLGPLGDPSVTADVTTGRVLDWLAGSHPEPFFLWVHYFDPHSTYDPPAPFDTMFQTDEALTAYLAGKGYADEATRPTGQVNRLHEGFNGYDGEVRFTDEMLGNVLAGLRARSRWDATLVVLLSDHGEGLNQHAEPGHGLVWTEQLHVPFLMRIPGVEPARRDELVSIVDVVPTLLGLLELPGEETILAQSSGTDVLRANYSPEPVFGQTSARQEKYGEDLTFSLTTPRWKLISPASGALRLYDLAADPYELTDVRAANPEVAEELHERLEAIVAKQERRAGVFKSGQLRDLTPSEVEGFRELGYVGGD